MGLSHNCEVSYGLFITQSKNRILVKWHTNDEQGGIIEDLYVKEGELGLHDVHYLGLNVENPVGTVYHAILGQ